MSYKYDYKTKTKFSFGIILCRFNIKRQVEILYVRKKCTNQYYEFLLSYYDKNNHEYLRFLFNGMSYEEKMDILTLDFGTMWYRGWGTNYDRLDNTNNLSSFETEIILRYKDYKKSFDNNFLRDNGALLRELISTSSNAELPWDFPKGKKINCEEKNINCAIREFQEETGIEPLHYTILNINSFSIHITNNNTSYISNLFLAITDYNNACTHHPQINYDNKHHRSEINDIKWMTLDTLKSKKVDKSIWNLSRTVCWELKNKYRLHAAPLV